MGIGPHWFDTVLIRNVEAGNIQRGDRFLDIGASELFCAADPESINRFIIHFGGEPWPPDKLIEVANRQFAAETFERAGFHYTAIDYADYPGIIRLDLNTGRLPYRHRAGYKFVFNSGTSEHVLNQWNVFKLIHDATAVGGLMYHGVPFSGSYQHGMLNYNPKFFWSLATDNGYDIVRIVASAEKEIASLPADFVQKLNLSKAPLMHEVWLHVTLRKQHDRKFRGANDPAFSAAATSPESL